MRITLYIDGKKKSFDLVKSGNSIIIDNKTTIQLDNSLSHIKSAFVNNKKVEFGWIKNGSSITILIAGRKISFEILDNKIFGVKQELQNGHVQTKSPIPGLITVIHKKAGDRVKKGEAILILNAMKMHNEMSSPKDGVVHSIHVKEGATVEKDQPLFTVK